MNVSSVSDKGLVIAWKLQHCVSVCMNETKIDHTIVRIKNAVVDCRAVINSIKLKSKSLLSLK